MQKLLSSFHRYIKFVHGVQSNQYYGYLNHEKRNSFSKINTIRIETFEMVIDNESNAHH